MKRTTGLFTLALCLLILPATDAYTWSVENPGDEEQKLMCDEHLSIEVGEDVTLDCHHPTGLDVTEESVYWKFNKNIYVLVFRDRKISNVDQEEQFKDRASEDSSWNPAEGKLSLKISPVKLEDAGTYTCYVRRRKMFCSTRLSITPKSDGPRKAPDGNHGDQGSDITNMVTEIVGSIGGVGTVLIVTIVGLVFYCFIRKKCCFRRI